jgi:multimeric flavodoxin WrbA
MKVVAFNGSPREDGNTSILLNLVLAEIAAEGIETELVQVGGRKIAGCTACQECIRNKDMQCSVTDDILNHCFSRMASADGILIGSPVYFTDVTPETKALIDRCGYVSRANGGVLRRKVGAGVAAVRRQGALHTLDTINHLFLISEMIIPGSTYWNLGIGREKGEVSKDEEGISTMQSLGRNMAWLLKKLAS